MAADWARRRLPIARRPGIPLSLSPLLRENYPATLTPSSLLYFLLFLLHLPGGVGGQDGDPAKGPHVIRTASLFARSLAAVCLYRQDMVLGRFNVRVGDRDSGGGQGVGRWVGGGQHTAQAETKHVLNGLVCLACLGTDVAINQAQTGGRCYKLMRKYSTGQEGARYSSS